MADYFSFGIKLVNHCVVTLPSNEPFLCLNIYLRSSTQNQSCFHLIIRSKLQSQSEDSNQSGLMISKGSFEHIFTSCSWYFQRVFDDHHKIQ